MRIQPSFQFFELARELCVRDDHFTQAHKCSYHTNACLNRYLAIQHARQHERAVFSENPG